MDLINRFSLVVLRNVSDEESLSIVILRSDSDEESNFNFLEILRYAQNDICFFLVILRNASDEESDSFYTYYSMIASYKSCHSGLNSSISASFFALVQPLICFSLEIAERTSVV